MPQHLAASVVLALTIVGSGLQSSAAQSPPKAQHTLIWSDRDLSLRPGSFDSGPELETTPRFPQIEAPADFSDGRQSDMLVCEPGRIGSAEAAAAAYAQLDKEWRLQTHR